VYPNSNNKQTSTSSTTATKNEDISDHVTPTYYNPATQTTHPTPPPTHPYYVLIPGTPATCVQLGLFHHAALFPHHPTKTPIDIVISGPNHGRNTTAAFALSSGTLGGALEAAIAGCKAVAVSFAFSTRREPEEWVAEACGLSARVVEKLVQGWDGGAGAGAGVPELYTVNVPLVEGVGKRPVRWTWMLGNKWSKGSLYKVVERGEGGGKEAAALDSVDEMKIEGQGQGEVEDEGGERNAAATPALQFKWSPTFADVWGTVEASADGNDGLAVKDGVTSVTPLRANFEGLYGKGGFVGELKL